MKSRMRRPILALLLALVATPVLADDRAPSIPSLDAPELAALGGYAVGVRSVTLVQPDQADPIKGGRADRVLPVEIWYPAKAKPGARPVVYSAALPGEPPRPPAEFTVPGLAVRDATEAAGTFPLVILSHGYSNAPEAMSWLGENLASKGYVVAAIHHNDPDIADRNGFPGPMLRRPLDIAFVARTLQDRARAHAPGLASADPDRMALIGYSMGGYGVLTVAGAALDAKGPLVQAVPDGALAAYAAGGPRQGELALPGLKAVVAIAPAGVRFGAWGTEGLMGVTSPLLLIGGDHDATVGFTDGIAPVFAQARRAERWMLVFQNAGHGIGMSAAPPQMRERLYDFHWFEDPVWRKDRIMGIDQHMITAFLDLKVKGQADRAAYLVSDVTNGADGRWPASAQAYDARSPGGTGQTWKGFSRNSAVGLELRYAAPAP